MRIKGDVRSIKAILVVIAIIIAVSSLYVSHLLTRDLLKEENTKMEVWAEAMRAFNKADETTDLHLVLKVLNTNNTIPVIVIDNNDNIQTYRNIEIAKKDTVAVLDKQLSRLRNKGRVIRITFDTQNENLSYNSPQEYLDIYYDESLILKRLSIYPYIQIGVVLIFVLIAILALLSFKRAEQNKVWVGLSKETAHQLGTPISSLMAWIELLQSKYPNDELVCTMSEDVARLQIVANRFSKIGSTPEIVETNLIPLLEDTIDYISGRISSKVNIVKILPSQPVYVKLNSSLFSWVIENISKNAIDAMNGVGTITITVDETTDIVGINVADTGKGIHKNKFNAVFSPGYTTKKRGWGLGLSLARRIVEEYHRGHIYVKQSEINKGTTFRIELKK